MTPGARTQTAVELLDEIGASTRDATQVIDSYFRKRRFAGSGDRRAITGRVYSVLRHRARLDWWITRSGLDLGIDNRTRVIAEILLGERGSPEDLIALFNGKRHAPSELTPLERSLFEALYGRPLVHQEMPDPVQFEYPEWMDTSLRALWGDRLNAEMAALNQTAPVDLRVNTLKATREDAQHALETADISCEPTPFSPIGLRLLERVNLGGTEIFKTGRIEVQDEGSQIIALLTDARPGMTVVDLCAGAGGKTLALAAQMAKDGKLTGRLTACDVSEYRLSRMEPRLKRAALRGIDLRTISAKEDSWIAANAGMADRVLADVPCTGTGAWRRDPENKWRFQPQDLEDLTSVQADILKNAASLVAPKGRLVYATCSLLSQENEAQIDRFLIETDAFELLDVEQVWRESIGGECPVSGPYLRLSPASTGTDGFFCAVLERHR